METIYELYNTEIRQNPNTFLSNCYTIRSFIQRNEGDSYVITLNKTRIVINIIYSISPLLSAFSNDNWF